MFSSKGKLSERVQDTRVSYLKTTTLRVYRLHTALSAEYVFLNDSRTIIMQLLFFATEHLCPIAMVS